MQLTTPVNIQPVSFQLTYKDVMMSMGSCFSDNIGHRLQEAFFPIKVNPFGVLFNPASIAISLNRIMESTLYTENELVFQDEIWHSMAHHGSFSREDKAETLHCINQTLQETREHLKSTRVLLLTFGTAWVYERDGEVVANCHKLPAKQFVRRRMSVEEIVEQYTTLIHRLTNLKPELKIIFTVSPVRHVKDGLHENLLSKAILLMAIEALCKQFSNVHYFPAYEIMIDELRDYRFYAEDMTHPNPQAVQYIWERFCATYMDKFTNTLVEQAEHIQRKLNHRSLYPHSPQAQNFKQQALMEAGVFQDFIKKL